MSDKEKSEVVEIPFGKFHTKVGITKSDFMQAAKLKKYNHRHLDESPAGVFVRYDEDTGKFDIVRPEEIKASGKIKIN